MGTAINHNKIYIDVIARFDAEGGIVPQEIIWSDGRRFPIRKVLDIRPRASLKAGGAGLCFTCQLDRVTRRLYLEENRWFVERPDR